MSPGRSRWCFRAPLPGTVVFRTTVMGHAGCASVAGPGKMKPGSWAKYNWRNFRGLNVVIDEELRSGVAPGKYHLLNLTMYEYEQRGDGHVQHSMRRDDWKRDRGNPDSNVDCLHHCVPGIPLQFFFFSVEPHAPSAESGERLVNSLLGTYREANTLPGASQRTAVNPRRSRYQTPALRRLPTT